MHVFEQLKAHLDDPGGAHAVPTYPPADTAEQVARAEHVPAHDLAKVVVVNLMEREA